jgi:hypothetical protein
MIDLVKDILLSPAGSFGSVAALFGLAFWLVHWITKKVTTINSSHDRLTGAVEKIESRIEKMQDDIVHLKVNVDIIKESAHPLSQARSPIALTEEGIEFYNKLNAEEMIAKNWDKIAENIEANVSNKNAYDIQKYISDTVLVSLETFIKESDVEKVKLFAYKEGRPLAYYAPVFWIPIRDRYLAQKGINISEVDTKVKKQR